MRQQKNPSQNQRQRDRSTQPLPSREAQLRKETKHGIAAVILLACAILSILSFMGLADVVGKGVDRFFALWFGWGKYLVPVIFAVLAYMFWKSEELKIRTSNWVGFLMFLLSFSGILHLFIVRQEAIEAIGQGRGGGYLGVALSYPLRQVMGPWATGVILICLLLIAILLWFDTSLPEMGEKTNVFSGLLMRFRRFRERLKRGWAMRSLDDEQRMEGEEAPIPDMPLEADDEALPAQTQDAIAEMEEKLKHEAKQQVAAAQAPLFKKRSGVKPFPIDLLVSSTERPSSGDIKANEERIQKTLATFGIEVEMGEINVGPTVTQFTLRPAEGVKLAQITTLSNDLALALAAHPIRIEAPIPGKSLVGVEVPNQSKAIVKLREILESPQFKKRPSALTFAIGKDVSGIPWIADLDRMPHLLIAGATGTGKSVCINSLLISLLYSNSPDSLRIILVDPKRVELTPYNDIPHLLTPVITKIDPTINALRWVTNEMDRRFRLFEETGKRNIAAFNTEATDPLPFIVVVIDELADLMAVAANEVEGAIIRLAQMARAVGIHLVVATQRPSVDVITGLIKANITARIAFSVASAVDSRTILDTSGAEKLLGRGDMLFVNAELSKPKRLQGAFVTDTEIESVMKFIKQQGSPEYEEHIVDNQAQAGSTGGVPGDPEDDEMYDEAKELVIGAGKASASYLQRRMRVGYARAARLLDLLEERGVIGPGDGAKPRDVYVTPMQPKETIHAFPEEDKEEEDEKDSDPKIY